MPQMRLDKFFSSQELLSRKEIKPYIKKGLIKVNGSPAKSPDQRIDAKLGRYNAKRRDNRI